MRCKQCEGTGRVTPVRNKEYQREECVICRGMGTVAEPEEQRIMEVKEGRVERVLKKS